MSTDETKHMENDPDLMRAIANGVSLADYCNMSNEDIDKEYDAGTAHWERLTRLAASHGVTITVRQESRESFHKSYRLPMNSQGSLEKGDSHDS